MSQDLILRLEEAGRLHWSVIERASGRRLHDGVADGELAELPVPLDAVNRTLVLLPAQSVFLAEIDLPARGDRDAQQAAPFAIEDELAAGLDDTHVVPGPRQETGRRWVMAARRDQVEAWRARVDALAVRPVHVLSCLLYTSPSPRDRTRSRMPSSA